MKFLILLFVYFAFCSANKLPSYLKACSAKDPNKSKCLTEQAKIALENLKNGDKTYNFPSLFPLTMDHADMSPGPGLKILVSNVKAYDIDKITFDMIDMDLDKKILAIKMTGEIEIIADYDAKGQLLVLPVEGKGPCNVTALATFHQNLPYELVDKSGQKYMKLLDTDTFTEDLQRVYFKFENLFNGDEMLGNQFNSFLNENWADVIKEVGPPIFNTVAELTKQLVADIVTTIPFNELLADV